MGDLPVSWSVRVLLAALVAASSLLPLARDGLGDRYLLPELQAFFFVPLVLALLERSLRNTKAIFGLNLVQLGLAVIAWFYAGFFAHFARETLLGGHLAVLATTGLALAFLATLIEIVRTGRPGHE
jgi:hypothetical protein